MRFGFTILKSGLVFLLLFPLFSVAGSLEKMEAIVKKAQNLNDFLSRQNLIDEYYAAAHEYYNTKKKEEQFPRANYDYLLNQLRGTLAHIPEMGERLWETNGLIPGFTLQSESPSFGRNLNTDVWNKTVADWKAAGKKGSDRFRGDKTERAATAQLKTTLSEISRKEEEIRGLTAGLSKKKAGAQSAELFNQLRDSSEVKDAAAEMYYRYISDPRVAALFESENADNILLTIKDGRENVEHLLKDLGYTDIPSSVRDEFKRLLPNFSELTSKKNTPFPAQLVRTAKGNWVPAESGTASAIKFVSIPRRFHGVFKGIGVDECVGAGCRMELPHTTPERWGTIAFHDSQLHYVEVDGRWNGFVHVVPFQTPNGVAGSVELFSSAMRQPLIQTSENGEKRKVSVFDRWMELMQKKLPRSWVGLAAGDSHGFNNEGSLIAVRSSPSYVLSKNVVSASQVGNSDSLADRIVSISPRTGITNKYGGRMIFDALSRENNSITIMTPTNETTQARVMRAIKEQDHDFVRDFLTKLYWASYDHEGNQNCVGDLTLHLREMHLLGPIAEAGYVTPTGAGNWHGHLSNFIPNLVKASFTPKEYRWARRFAVPRDFSHQLDFVQKVGAQVSDPGIMSLLYEPEVPRPVDGELKMYDTHFGAQIPHFLSLNPTPADLLSACHKHHAYLEPGQFHTLLDRLFTGSGTNREIIEALSMEMGNFDQMEASIVLQKMHEHRNKFLGEEMTLEDRLHLSETIETIRAKVGNNAAAQKQVDELSRAIEKNASENFKNAILEASGRGELKKYMEFELGHVKLQDKPEFYPVSVVRAMNELLTEGKINLGKETKAIRKAVETVFPNTLGPLKRSVRAEFEALSAQNSTELVEGLLRINALEALGGMSEGLQKSMVRAAEKMTDLPLKPAEKTKLLNELSPRFYRDRLLDLVLEPLGSTKLTREHYIGLTQKGGIASISPQDLKRIYEKAFAVTSSKQEFVDLVSKPPVGASDAQKEVIEHAAAAGIEHYRALPPEEGELEKLLQGFPILEGETLQRVASLWTKASELRNILDVAKARGASVETRDLVVASQLRSPMGFLNGGTALSDLAAIVDHTTNLETKQEIVAKGVSLDTVRSQLTGKTAKEFLDFCLSGLKPGQPMQEWLWGMRQEFFKKNPTGEEFDLFLSKAVARNALTAQKEYLHSRLEHCRLHNQPMTDVEFLSIVRPRSTDAEYQKQFGEWLVAELPTYAKLPAAAVSVKKLMGLSPTNSKLRSDILDTFSKTLPPGVFVDLLNEARTLDLKTNTNTATEWLERNPSTVLDKPGMDFSHLKQVLEKISKGSNGLVQALALKGLTLARNPNEAIELVKTISEATTPDHRALVKQLTLTFEGSFRGLLPTLKQRMAFSGFRGRFPALMECFKPIKKVTDHNGRKLN